MSAFSLLIAMNELLLNPPLVRVCGEKAGVACTILWQGAVNGVHLLEKTDSYRGVIFVD